METRTRGGISQAMASPVTFLGAPVHLNHSLNSLKGGYVADYIRSNIGVIKGDTRSLDYSSCELPPIFPK